MPYLYVYMSTHTYTHTYIHTYMHAYIHIHSLITISYYNATHFNTINKQTISAPPPAGLALSELDREVLRAGQYFSLFHYCYFINYYYYYYFSYLSLLSLLALTVILLIVSILKMGIWL